jgi:hypothetical protein
LGEVVEERKGCKGRIWRDEKDLGGKYGWRVVRVMEREN